MTFHLARKGKGFATCLGIVALVLMTMFSPSASAETFPCTADSDCTEDAFPTLDKTCVKAYVCEDGSCTFVPDVLACTNWEAELDCDDDNPCTVDKFVWGKCRNVAWLMSGKHCDDDDACTLDTKCSSSGTCGGGVPLACDDDNACTDDVCDPDSGCGAVGMVCTNDGKECTTDSCNPATGVCSSANSAFPTACGVANSGMVCNGSGGCISPECLKDSDCAGDNVSSCEGGIESLNVATCEAGVCVLGAEPEYNFPCEFGCDGNECGAADNDCNDDDPCTDDSLEVLIPGVHAQCKHVDDGVCCSVNADCDDDNECTDDICTAGTCSNAAAALDGDPCGTAGTCNAGLCEEPPPAPGPSLSGTLEVSSGNLIQGSLGLKKPGSDPAVPSALWKDHGTTASFANPECFLGNVLKADGKYALGGSSDDPLVTDPDGDFCAGITVDESVFTTGKSPTELGCVVLCSDQGAGKPSTLNWICGSCAE